MWSYTLLNHLFVFRYAQADAAEAPWMPLEKDARSICFSWFAHGLPQCNPRAALQYVT